jgi:hypothetical protein
LLDNSLVSLGWRNLLIIFIQNYKRDREAKIHLIVVGFVKNAKLLNAKKCAQVDPVNLARSIDNVSMTYVNIITLKIRMLSLNRPATINIQ